MSGEGKMAKVAKEEKMADDIRPVTDLKWRKDLYPRIEHDPVLVQRYAKILAVLPPAEINQDSIIIDGYHRWLAYRKADQKTMPVVVTETESEDDIRRLAIIRNAKSGLQLSEASKKNNAIWLYKDGAGYEKPEIAAILSVTLQTVTNYLKNIDDALREARKKLIFDLWLSCHTDAEIAEAVGQARPTIVAKTQLLSDLNLLENPTKVAALFGEKDWKPPIYNIWSYAAKTNRGEHFGNSEQRILENLLYLYTEPFDVVFDPFAGGGSTIDVCKERVRRYWVSDRKVIPERENEIRQRDVIEDGLEPYMPWREVTLTYLDPPYWKQAEGEYSDDAEDLANMPLDQFTSSLATLIKAVARKQRRGAIAMLMQPTQWRAENRRFTDHVFDLVRAARGKNLELEYRVSCPYSTEQVNQQQVIWAKENKKLLILTRELVVWKIGT